MTVREFILACDSIRFKRVRLVIDCEYFLTAYIDEILKYIPWQLVENKDFIFSARHDKADIFELLIMTRRFEDGEKILETSRKVGKNKVSNLILEIIDDWPYRLYINDLRIPGFYTISDLMMLELDSDYTYNIDKQMSNINVYSNV